MTNWLSDINNDLEELSNISLQHKRWLDENFDEVSSYNELMCSFFDDNSIEEFMENELDKYSNSIELKNSLRYLLTELTEYDSKNLNDIEIINDKRWQAIVELAKNVKTLWELNIV